MRTQTQTLSHGMHLADKNLIANFLSQTFCCKMHFIFAYIYKWNLVFNKLIITNAEEKREKKTYTHGEKQKLSGESNHNNSFCAHYKIDVKYDGYLVLWLQMILRLTLYLSKNHIFCKNLFNVTLLRNFRLQFYWEVLQFYLHYEVFSGYFKLFFYYSCMCWKIMC